MMNIIGSSLIYKKLRFATGTLLFCGLLLACGTARADISSTGLVSEDSLGNNEITDWGSVDSDTQVYVAPENSSQDASVTVSGGSQIDSSAVYAGYDLNGGYNGSVEVTGTGSRWDALMMAVGDQSSGSLRVENGAELATEYWVGIGSRAVGAVEVDNASIEMGNYLIFGWGEYETEANGSSLDITGGGTVKAANNLDIRGCTATLTIENGTLMANDVTEDSASYASELTIRVGPNGKLAYAVADDPVIADFTEYGSTEGSGDILNLQIWDGGSYVSYDTLTEGEDYFLENGTDELSGYGVLSTVPEPMMASIMFLAGVLIFAARRFLRYFFVSA